MKQKKLIALLLSTALLLSGVNVQTSKAADEQKQQTVAVTLHMERDADTVLAPVTVTMTEDDKNNDFGIGLATGCNVFSTSCFCKIFGNEEKGYQ